MYHLYGLSTWRLLTVYIHALLSVVMMAALAMVGFLPCEKDF